MISKLCVRGTYKNQCEDSVFVKETESSVFGCVCDGCSTGINSAWASQLLCYLVHPETIKITSADFVRNIASNIQYLKKVLLLSEMNFLSTCLLFHYNKEENVLFLRTLGDGFYYINRVEYAIDHNNIPDYLAYHLDDVESYLDKYPELVYENVDSFQICTDGIKSFSVSQFKDVPDIQPDILLKNPTGSNYLQRMYNLLTKKGWAINDDLSIISYANLQESNS